MKIAIIGYGHVERSMNKKFSGAVIYDDPDKNGGKQDVDDMCIAFISSLPSKTKKMDEKNPYVLAFGKLAISSVENFYF